MSLMTVGLCFNLRTPSSRDGPEDAQAEYDAWTTVSALAEALSFEGACRVLPLPFGADLPRLLAVHRPDVVFNIAEGHRGRSREALAPAVLELMEIPYTGSDPVALGLALDKQLARQVAASAGLEVAWGEVAASSEQAADLARRAPLPAFVKPVAEGSSMGVRRRSRVDSPKELEEQVRWVLEVYQQPALVEAFLPGREFSVGILGDGPSARALPVLEVRPAEPQGADGFVYCYHTKQDNRELLLCPAPVEPGLAEALQHAAGRIFRAMGLRDVARVDFRLGADGRPRFLEVNPLPGLSAASLLTAQGRAAGLQLQGLVAAIMASACRRWRRQPHPDPGFVDRLARLAVWIQRFLPDRGPWGSQDGAAEFAGAAGASGAARLRLAVGAGSQPA